MISRVSSWDLQIHGHRTSNPGCSSEQVVSNLALQYQELVGHTLAAIPVVGVERDFGGCGGLQPPISKTLSFEVDLI